MNPRNMQLALHTRNIHIQTLDFSEIPGPEQQSKETASASCNN